MRQNLILEKLHKARLLPLFYINDVNVSKNLIDALTSTSLSVIEFTNRGTDAKNIFPELIKHVENKTEVEIMAL